MINLERHKNRIVLRSDRKIKSLDKSIPGANFARTGGAHWTLPLNWDNCVLLGKKFKKELVINPDLADWVAEKKAHRKRMTALGKADEAELPGLWLSGNPRLWKAVTKGRKYQSAGARFISEGRTVIVSDTVGLGKTAQTLAAIMESQVKGPYLIVCPKTAVETVWAREVEHWLPDAYVTTCPEGRAKRNGVLDVFAEHAREDEFVIVHPKMLATVSWWVCRKKACRSKTRVHSGKKELVCGDDAKKTNLLHEHEYPQLFKHEWGAIVADESHESLLKRNKLPTQVRRGMEMLQVKEGGLKIAQSATPWRSRPHLLWSTLNWLFPDEYTAFWPWAQTVYETEEGFGSHSIVIKDLNPKREKMLHRTLDSVMLRRTRAEVAEHLPRRQYLGTHFTPGDETSPVGIWLPLTGSQLKAYKEIEETGEAEIEGGELDAIGSLAELTRMRQFASSSMKVVGEDEYRPCLPSNKFDYMVDILTNELGFPDDPTTKIVVVSKYTELLELFATELKKQHKIESMMLTGKVSAKRRKEAQLRFNSEDPPHILFMNTEVGGSSITLDAPDEMWFLDESWISDDQEQCEGRIDNRRPEEKIVQRRYRYLRSLGTVEVGIAFTNVGTSIEDRRLLDERRGVQYVRDVIEATFRQSRS